MNPYSDLPKAAFWRSGVQDSAPTNMAGLYQRKWPIRANENVATAGSCFAQHIARFMKKNGFSVLDMEPPPRGLPEKFAKNYGYCLYSARYGNIYTVRQLLQLIHEAEGRFVPVDPVWERGGRYFDSQRPNVEPQGLDSPDEVLAHRRVHLEALRALLRRQDIFVFTLGLTEAWIDAPTGTVYPTAPGVIAGSFDPTRHQFKNFGFNEIYADLVAVRRALRRYRPQLRILLTVSPVPLTATASGRHVLQASTYSKAVLRAVAGQFSAEHDDVD
ncbi:MAG: GSCFA domain-containing protein, partial [Hyphomonadaceae bacterium]